MNMFLKVLEAMFDWTWRTSIQASILTVLVLFLQGLLSRWLSPRLCYLLSLLILFRLLLPVVPTSSFSAENLLQMGTRSTRPNVTSALDPALTTELSPVRPVSGLSLSSVAGVIWFSGVLTLVCLASWRYFAWRRVICLAPPVSDVRLLGILDSARHALGIRRRVTLLSVPQLASPAVFGFRRVCLLVPETALAFLNEEEWRLVFMHEMAHIRNKDTVLNSIAIAMKFVHWFNPLVWIGLSRMRADQELVCDAMAMERVEPGERLGYGQILLKLAEVLSLGHRVFQTAVPVIGGKRELKRRMLMIVRYRSSGLAIRVVAIGLVMMLWCLSFTRAQDRNSQQEPTGQPGPLPADEPGILPIDKVTATNGAVVSYRPTIMSADRLTVYPEQHELVAEILHEFKKAGYSLPKNVLDDGHVKTSQGEQLSTSEHLATNFATNRASSAKNIMAINIRYVGPKLVKEEEIRQKIRVQVGSSYSPVSLDDDVRRLYDTGLFYNIRLSAETSPDGIGVTYVVQCNLRLAKLTFRGNSSFSDAQLGKFVPSKIGDVFSERKLFSDAQAIQEMYRKAGYKSTMVKYSFDVDADSDKAFVAFIINEGN